MNLNVRRAQSSFSECYAMSVRRAQSSFSECHAMSVRRAQSSFSVCHAMRSVIIATFLQFQRNILRVLLNRSVNDSQQLPTTGQQRDLGIIITKYLK